MVNRVMFLVGMVSWIAIALFLWVSPAHAERVQCSPTEAAKGVILGTPAYPQFLAQGHMAYGADNIVLNQVVRVALEAQGIIDRSTATSPETTALLTAHEEAIAFLLCKLEELHQ